MENYSLQLYFLVEKYICKMTFSCLQIDFIGEDKYYMLKNKGD